MASRSSVNRPPTPEPEGRVGGGGEPTSLRQVVDAKVRSVGESGEKERLKARALSRETGWKTLGESREKERLKALLRDGLEESGRLLESGEKERLKTLLRDRLEECGWADDLLVYARPLPSLSLSCLVVRPSIRAYVSKVGRENVSLEELIRAITPKGRASVPGPVKAELLQRIQSFLTTK
ncbi:unnamed protein product [Closterium sp. Naga37s-1]|nr:unnamed protein product [Closterium sp. Naga37s-1]